MEGNGSGGPSLEPRVRQLEHSVESLHSDMARMSNAISGVSAQVTGLSKSLTDVADKLDIQRTKRPELGALAGLASVILALVGAVMWPAYERMARLEAHDTLQQETLSERGVVIGEFSSDRRHIEEELGQLRLEIGQMKGDRFTKQDGQRMLDLIIRLHHPELDQND